MEISFQGKESSNSQQRTKITDYGYSFVSQFGV